MAEKRWGKERSKFEEKERELAEMAAESAKQLVMTQKRLRMTEQENRRQDISNIKGESRGAAAAVKVELLEAEQNRINAELVEAKQAKEELAERVDRQADEIRDLTSKAGRVSGLEERIADMRKQVLAAENAAQTAIANAQRNAKLEMSEAEGKAKAAAEQAAKDAARAMSELEAKMKALKAKQSGAASRVEEMEKKNKKLEAELSDAHKELVTAKRAADDAAKKHAASEDAAISIKIKLEEDLDNAKKEMGKLQKALSAAEAKNAAVDLDMESKISTLKRVAEEMKENVNTLEKACLEKDAMLEKMNAQLDAAMASSEGVVKGLEGELAALRNQLDAALLKPSTTEASTQSIVAVCDVATQITPPPPPSPSSSSSHGASEAIEAAQTAAAAAAEQLKEAHLEVDKLTDEVTKARRERDDAVTQVSELIAATRTVLTGGDTEVAVRLIPDLKPEDVVLRVSF